MSRLGGGLVLGLALAAAGRVQAGAPRLAPPAPYNRLEPFAATLKFLDAHTPMVLLRDPATGAAVAVAPAFAGRVMVSAWDMDRGPALGWINREAIAGKRDPQFVNYGGAERLWVSPEGGQWSPFFKPGAPFELKAWMVPHAFNDEPFTTEERDGAHVMLSKNVDLVNWQGAPLALSLIRRISVLSRAEIEAALGVPLPAALRSVGYRSANVIVNRGPAPLSPATGLVSAWILCQFVPSARTLVLAPYEKAAAGPVVNDDYFGRVPADRLKVDAERGVIQFRADGKQRGKIGLTAARARDVLGAMDFANDILTIVRFAKPAKGEWLKNTWKKHEDPFGGDVVNSYNDGPPGPGLPALGGFYELENLGPAVALPRGGKSEHWSATIHLSGPFPELAAIAAQVLGADLTALAESRP